MIIDTELTTLQGSHPQVTPDTKIFRIPFCHDDDRATDEYGGRNRLAAARSQASDLDSLAESLRRLWRRVIEICIERHRDVAQ